MAMTSLLLFVLAPIALLDSTSIVPLCVVPLAALLGGDRPFAGAISFLLGIFVAYTGSGVLLLLGLDFVLDSIAPIVSRWWNDPNTPELILQLVIGLVLIAFGWRLGRSREGGVQKDQASGMTPGSAFSLGFAITLAGMPGALPYLGAIDQILRSDLSDLWSIACILFYNAVFISPMALLMLAPVLMPARSEQIIRWVSVVSARWGRRLILTALMLCGVALAADAIGWFVGYPLLPTQPVSQVGS